MDTQFAPAERISLEAVLEQKANIEASEFLDKVMTKTPFMFFILNEQRQVVYSNHQLMEHLGFVDMIKMVGFRPGELFKCIHSDKEPGGCGTSKTCRYCGALLAVLESKRTGELVVKEATLNLNIHEKVVPANFRVSSKPFTWKEESYFIVTMDDISSIKRKEQLEKTFFHDIKNKAGTVSGFLNLLLEQADQDNKDMYLQIANRGITELLEDIDYQRTYLRAESGELDVNETLISAQEIVHNTIEDYQRMAAEKDITLQLANQEVDCNVNSDPVLLKRVLGNLVKNALEASKKDDIVTAGYENDEREVRFIVTNPGIMPENVKHQIFNRSFSTKGTGRGIGTYSVKLLTENYLKGNVSFTSEEPEGTAFKVVLPLKPSGRDC